MRPSQVVAYPAEGEILDGKYQVLHMLGEGGMGAVAKAHHILRRAPVALKFMAPHVLTIPGAVERFLNEAVAASQIENQHVVTIYDVGKLQSGAPYLVMEYLEGRDLSHLIEHEGAQGIDVPRAVHFVLQVLRALQAAHAVGIIHRDLKPSNAFVIKKDGERDFVKLVDFGISKVQQPGAASLTQTNSALGTPLYMSPEQAKSPRDVDLRSDLYSVACILYELLTGRTPHFAESGELTEILFKLFTQDPTPISDIRKDLPEGLAEVVHHGLARERDTRFSTALDFAEALAPYADERSLTVIRQIRAGIEKRSEPIPGGSMPAPMPSMQQAFSQLGMQHSAVQVQVVTAHSPAMAQTPQEFAARTQALPSNVPMPPTQQSPQLAAIAGTQASGTHGSASGAAQTGMGVSADAAAEKPKSKAGLLVLAPLVPLGIIGALAFVGFKTFSKPTVTNEPSPPMSATTVLAAQPPVTPTAAPTPSAPPTAGTMTTTPGPAPSASATAKTPGPTTSPGHNANPVSGSRRPPINQ